MSRPLKGKAGIRAFLLAHIGEVVTTEQIREASGNQGQYGRRLRELRDEEGWPIESYRDATDLRADQYRLASIPSEGHQTRFARGISAKVRAQVLDRNGFTCRMCGVAAGDDDEQGRTVVLHVGHIIDKSHGGADTLDNLRALCSRCNQGAKNITQEPPSWLYLLTQIRRAKEDDQRAALAWLQRKFGGNE